MSTPTGTASIYIRVSRAADDDNLSVAGMEADCRALAERHGLSVIAVHVDDGISGAVRDRPAFLAWLADAEEGRAGTLLAWSVDRLTREGVNVVARVLDVLEGRDADGKKAGPGVRLLTHDGIDSHGDEQSFRWRFVIAAEVARAERDKMVQRNQARSDRLKAAGRWTGGNAPYATKAVPAEDGKGKVLAPVPEEVAFLRDAANRLMRGDSLRSTSVWMNTQDMPPRRAPNWTPTGLKMTLRTACTHNHVFSPAEAAEIRPLVTPDPKRNSALKAQRSLLARGLLACSGCGRGMVPSGTKARPLYGCPAQHDTAPCERPVSVSGKHADAVVENEYLRRYGMFRLYEEEVIVTSDADVDAATVAYEDAQARLTVELSAEALEAAKAAREALDAAKAATPTREVVLRDTGKTMRDAWEEGDAEKRAKYLRDVMSGPITVQPPTKRGYATEEAMRARVADRLVYSWRGEHR